ncbi:MAG: hypothetical protein V1897_10730 [Pseudomonadota bacterium]
MILRYRVLFFLFLALLGVGALDRVQPQDFPYQAPVAPEVDNGVPQTRGPGKTNNDQKIGPRIDPLAPETIKNFSFGPPTQDYQDPVVSKPHSNKQSAPVNSESRPAMPQDSRSPVSGPRQSVPAQQPRRVDCSQYPAMIANARSESEMQITARYYLTCLLQSGVPLEHAKTQVIQTIEAVTRASR